MQIEAVRVDQPMRAGDCHSYCIAHRDDGVSVRIPGYGPGLPLPHDLAHYVIERELGLGRGFWATVAAGAVFPGMQHLAGRQRPHAAERSRLVQKENGGWVNQAEVLVGAFMEMVTTGIDARSQAALALLANAQGAVAVGSLPVDAATLARVCAALRAMAERWVAVVPGECMTLEWRGGARAAVLPHARGRHGGRRALIRAR